MFEVGTIDYSVYEDATEFVGIANVQLPEKVQKSITMNGSGIGGDVEVPIRGSYDAMTLTISFRTFSEKVAALREPRRHQIELRIAQQSEDPINGTTPVNAVKHVFIGVPKSASGGTVAPASAADCNVTFSVRYWATYVDGKKVDEIDQLNRVDIVNGIDSNDPVRKALGK